ncbi:MAG: hypothetical protein IPN71_10370 [Fibrobacteres bacterium]|nr:hypothetical protein [Fibrobacterota bacterium]
MTSPTQLPATEQESLAEELGLDFCLRHEVFPVRIGERVMLHFSAQPDPEPVEGASDLVGVPAHHIAAVPCRSHGGRQLAGLRGRRAAQGESGLLAGLSEDDLSVGKAPPWTKSVASRRPSPW